MNVIKLFCSCFDCFRKKKLKKEIDIYEKQKDLENNTPPILELNNSKEEIEICNEKPESQECRKSLTKCPNNHGLLIFGAPNNTWWCSICDIKVGKGAILYGCRRCDFDLCNNCYDDSQQEIVLKQVSVDSDKNKAKKNNLNSVKRAAQSNHIEPHIAPFIRQAQSSSQADSVLNNESKCEETRSQAQSLEQLISQMTPIKEDSTLERDGISPVLAVMKLGEKHETTPFMHTPYSPEVGSTSPIELRAPMNCFSPESEEENAIPEISEESDEETWRITGEWIVTDIKNNINYIYYWDWDQLGVGKRQSRLGYEFKCITKNKGKNRFVWREFAIADDASTTRLRIMKCKMISHNRFVGKMKIAKTGEILEFMGIRKQTTFGEIAIQNTETMNLALMQRLDMLDEQFEDLHKSLSFEEFSSDFQSAGRSPNRLERKTFALLTPLFENEMLSPNNSEKF